MQTIFERCGKRRGRSRRESGDQQCRALHIKDRVFFRVTIRQYRSRLAGRQYGIWNYNSDIITFMQFKANRMRDTPAQGNVRAKTGTMSNIRSLAGYVTTRDGEQLAFVIMLNNFEGTGAAATEAVDAIAVRLAGFSRTQ